MVKEGSAGSYEDSWKQRLLENKRRIEDLGLLKLAKNLSDVKKSEKSQAIFKHRQARPKPNNNYLLEPRRSSRQRNPVPSYRDDVDVELPSLRNRSKFSSSWASSNWWFWQDNYLARPVEEVKAATFEERARAYKCAEKLQSNLQSGNPSFVKSMVRSHVYSCFWLGLPAKFCVDHLPKSTVDMVLENEQGSQYEAIFISKRTGLSGGWRAFALDHKLDDGDAVVFELIEPRRFKVYIVRAFNCESQDDDEPVADVGSNAEETSKETKKKRKKIDNHQTVGTDPKRIDNHRTVGTDPEETSKVVKKREDNQHQPKGSIESEKKSPQVLAPRRSLRNKR